MLSETCLPTLLGRGVTPLPPAEPADWARLKRRFNLVPGPDFRAVYTRFNGFLVHDPGSMMMLWSLDQMVSEPDVLLGGSVAIGDVLIHSDLIVAPIAADEAPVKLLHEGRDLAPSLLGFVERLAGGAFDWLT